MATKTATFRKRNSSNNALLRDCKDAFNKKIYAMALDIMNQPMTTLDEAEANLVNRISGFYNAASWAGEPRFAGDTADQNGGSHVYHLRLMANPMAAWHMCEDEEYAEVTRLRVIKVMTERLDSSDDATRLNAAGALGRLLRPAPCCAHVSFLNQIGAL